MNIEVLMISFFVCLVLLILSFFTYGKYVERIFVPTYEPITFTNFIKGYK